MLAAYLTGALLCLAALAVGQAAMALCGRDRPSPLAPAVGLSLLLIVANLAIQLPGRATTAAIALGVLAAAAIGVLLKGGGDAPATTSRAPGPAHRSRPGDRSGGAGVVPAAPLLAVLLAVFAVSIPFLANGRMGPLGQGLVNDDMASHLLFAEWVAHHVGRTPDLVADGYPLAPHSLVAAVAKPTGASFVEAFAGLSFAIAALAALTAYGALDVVRPWLRVPAAVLVALPYLGAAWLAQGAFKEPILALFLVAFALGLREVGKPRAAIPLGLIAAGTLYAYSFPGLAWLAGTAIAWAAILWLRDRRLPDGAPFAICAGIVVLAALPELGRLIDFASFGAFDPEGSGPRVGLGNLDNALTPLEGLNVWPASDFRVDATAASLPAIVFYLGGLLGAAVLGWGTLAAVARRESALPAALVAGALGYLGALAFGTPYTSAKALVIAAPIAMLIALRGLLTSEVEGEAAPGVGGEAADSSRGGYPLGTRQGDAGSSVGEVPGTAGYPRRAPNGGIPYPLRVLRIPLAVAFVIGAAVSSFLPLRAGAVGPATHAEELISLGPATAGHRILFLGRDQFAAWELFHSPIATPIESHYNAKSIGNRFPSTPASAKLDFDAVTPRNLDFYRYVITTRAGYQSAPPPNFKLVRTTPDYALWMRIGPTARREVLDEPRGPGAVLDCSTPAGKKISEEKGTASVLPAPPVVGPEAGWQPSPRVTDSRPASQELTLDPGRWSISLQYVATQKATVTAPGLDATLPANLDFRGPAPFWPLGEVEVSRRAPVRFTLSVKRPPLFGRLINADARAFPLSIAATPVGGEQRVPLARACGRYVDFYEPAGRP